MIGLYLGNFRDMGEALCGIVWQCRSGSPETDEKENRMQLATPLTMLSGVLRNAGLERGRSIANAQAGIEENLPIDQLLIMAVSLCSQSANPKGYGPVDLVGRRHDIHGEFD